MPLTSPGNDDDTGENHQPTLRKNTAEPVEQTLKQNNLDIDRLYDPAADEATLASDPATGSGDMRFDHWFEDQYWADETDGGE